MTKTFKQISRVQNTAKVAFVTSMILHDFTAIPSMLDDCTFIELCMEPQERLLYLAIYGSTVYMTHTQFWGRWAFCPSGQM